MKYVVKNDTRVLGCHSCEFHFTFPITITTDEIDEVVGVPLISTMKVCPRCFSATYSPLFWMDKHDKSIHDKEFVDRIRLAEKLYGRSYLEEIA